MDTGELGNEVLRKLLKRWKVV